MCCPVKITWKWGNTLVPGFICWKIIFDLGIYGGHFVFALKKFRPGMPKWHPDDSCSGHPIVSESIIKRRPYRETRFRQNLLDYFQSVFFATMYSKSSYVISGFCCGRHFYLSYVYNINMYVSCNHYKSFNTCTYIYTTFYFIILCAVSYNVSYNWF